MPWASTFLRRWQAVVAKLRPQERSEERRAHEVHRGSAKGSRGKRNDALRFTSEAETPKNPIDGKALRFTRKAHIDIYQGVRASATRTSPSGTGKAHPELPAFLDRRTR